MNRLLPKILIFLTFFGSCIIIGLLSSALVTNCWIIAKVSFISPGNITTKTQELRSGKIQLGLFNYQKALNHGYGLRHENYSILHILKTEDGFMDYWLWILTTLGTGFALFSSVIASVASVIGTIRRNGGMVLMIVSNTSAGIGQLIAFICWNLQFLFYLKQNIVLLEEKKHWTSANQATFGYSFLLIIIAFVIVLVNLVFLMSAIRIEKRHFKNLKPIEEKESNSIMLY